MATWSWTVAASSAVEASPRWLWRAEVSSVTSRDNSSRLLHDAKRENDDAICIVSGRRSIWHAWPAPNASCHAALGWSAQIGGNVRYGDLHVWQPACNLQQRVSARTCCQETGVALRHAGHLSANDQAGTGRRGRHAQNLSGGSFSAASALRATGLNLGVATMRIGERCTLHVDARYGYGDAGAYARHSLPCSAIVVSSSSCDRQKPAVWLPCQYFWHCHDSLPMQRDDTDCSTAV